MRWPRRPRFLHRLWARLCGYFWLPCPLCGEEFGGHEWILSDRYVLPLGGERIGTCPRCPVEVVQAERVDDWRLARCDYGTSSGASA